MTRPLRSRLVRGLLAAILGFIAVEGLLRLGFSLREARVTEIPLPYIIGDATGPVAPWIGRLRILEPDPTLIWKNKPSVHRRYLDLFTPMRREDDRVALLRRLSPAPPPELRGSASWDLSLNADGFRDIELPRNKPPSVFRIVCLGDSWTFGSNVDQSATYPAQLRKLLAQAFPGIEFEIFNLGVMGYSSHQGLTLMRQRIAALQPDLVVLGYAMNDASPAGYHDRDVVAKHGARLSAASVARRLGHLETLNLLRYGAAMIVSRRPPIDARLRAKAAASRDVVDYDALHAWTRVPAADYASNVRAMIDLAHRHHADVILLYNELWVGGPYFKILEEVARSENVPLVDGSGIVAQARRRVEASVAAQLGLDQHPAQPRRSANEVEVVFRVHADGYSVPDALAIAGTDPALGDAVPNRVRMYDDGTHGDQKAGDGVWSLAATLPAGRQIFYVYTNSGRPGQWEGLDLPHIRSLHVDGESSQEPLYAPVETFGRAYLQADPWHTNGAGYELIARAVFETLVQQETVRRYLARERLPGPAARQVRR